MIELRENTGVQIRFLLGPSGSGKTFRCLSEARAALLASPAGPPLVFLAPKQATFQLERQLLGDTALAGYTRMHILSFERFALLVLRQLGFAEPRLLAEEGRVMVLRAMLAEKQRELQVYHATARLPGFAQQVSTVIREFQQSRISPRKLAAVAEKLGPETVLARKVGDLAVLMNGYHDWLTAHRLQDGNALLDIAAQTLRDATRSGAGLVLGGLWLDGFAEMTAQELDLLAAALPFTQQATLAFCLEHEPLEQPSWLSTWSIVAQTYRRCRARLSELPASVTILPQRDAPTRFSLNPPLAYLERHWTTGGVFDADQTVLRVVACANAEAEAAFAAREIRRYVRRGGRYRDCAVSLRSLDGYGDILQRIFTRYEVPFFLDRREPVAHHPMAELTRFALRTVAFRWQNEDWFGALKSGLLPLGIDDVDVLENAALARGWNGDRWLQPLADAGADPFGQRLESYRAKAIAPLIELLASIGACADSLTGQQLADALAGLWANAGVAERLDEWSRAAAPNHRAAPAVHLTVWEQMNEWLNNVRLAFDDVALPLRDWLPIVEAGLSGLTVGIIPPALDQILIGAIDRSRNPELRLSLLLGVNESVFPAPPAKPILLNDRERELLAREDTALGPTLKQRLGHERYYGYIACTRSRERLVITYAKTDSSGAPLQPSAFIRHVQHLFPRLQLEEPPVEIAPNDAEHFSELITPLLKSASEHQPPAQRAAGLQPGVRPAALSELALSPQFASVLAKWRSVSQTPLATLPDSAVQKLYGPRLPISVSALEEFAACPFKFFVSRGLGAEEREEFEPDARQRGSFQHAILARFHETLASTNRRWRDVSANEARDVVERIGTALIAEFENGVFNRDAAARFTARVLIENTQALVATLVTWARHYEFEPAAVELGFGVKDALLPGWTIDLAAGRALLLRGRIDRIDLWRSPDDSALAVIVDYKSRSRELDMLKLQHGLELQLLSYLAVVRGLDELRQHFKATRLDPAGVFYVNLGARRESGASRETAAGVSPYRHLGRFDGENLRLFDARATPLAEQFKFALNKGGSFSKRGNEALGRAEFAALVETVETQLRQHGREIFAGSVAVSPFRKGKEKACDRCDYAAVCRFDPWTQNYRVLRKTSAHQNGGDE